MSNKGKRDYKAVFFEDVGINRRSGNGVSSCTKNSIRLRSSSVDYSIKTSAERCGDGVQLPHKSGNV